MARDQKIYETNNYGGGVLVDRTTELPVGFTAQGVDQYMVIPVADPLTGGTSLLVGGNTFAPTSLASRLSIAYAQAKGKNPFDFASGTTQPLVSLVTVNAAAISPGVSVGYFDTGAYDKIRVVGIPYKDTSLMVNNNGIGAVSVQNPSGPTGAGYAGMASAENSIGSQFATVRVTCSAMQWNVSSSGLSSNYFPLWVNGIAVSPNTPAAVTSGASGNLNIAFAARGTYDVTIGSEQSALIKGVTVSEDDTIHAVTDVRLPIVVYGDSYITGFTSPAVAGGTSLVGAISHIGGINAIASGATSTGYVNDGGYGFSMTFSGRMQYTAALANAANAPLIMVTGGYNDVSIPASSASVQAAATTVFNYLIANTSSNIIAFGAMPGQRNNSAATQAVDAGIAAAVSAINNSRLAFVAVSGASQPWVTGTRYTAVPTGLVAGNSRYFTGDDAMHPSPFVTGLPTATSVPAPTTPSSGVEYLARRMLDAAMRVATLRNW